MSQFATRSIIKTTFAVLALSAAASGAFAGIGIPAGEAAYEVPAVVASSVSRAEVRQQAVAALAAKSVAGFNAEAGTPLFVTTPQNLELSREAVRQAAIEASMQKAMARFVAEAGGNIGE